VVHVCYLGYGVTHQKVLISVFIAVDTSNRMTGMFVIKCTEKLIVPSVEFIELNYENVW
jgi:hypothetical protein